MDDLNNTIYFYGLRDYPSYYYLSNFFQAEIVLDDKKWPTTEHYFQAMKFSTTSPDLVEKVRLAKLARDAKAIGRDQTLPIRQDWQSVKEDYMEKALYAKFTQHPKIKTKLLSTGDKKLVERTKNDSYWGDGGDGTGKNRLGFLLEKIRNRIRDEMKNYKPDKETNLSETVKNDDK